NIHVTLDVQVTGDVGTRKAERARRLSQVGDGGRRLDRDLDRRVGRPCRAPVERLEADWRIRARDPLEYLGQSHLRPLSVVPWMSSEAHPARTLLEYRSGSLPCGS